MPVSSYQVFALFAAAVAVGAAIVLAWGGEPRGRYRRFLAASCIAAPVAAASLSVIIWGVGPAPSPLGLVSHTTTAIGMSIGLVIIGLVGALFSPDSRLSGHIAGTGIVGLLVAWGTAFAADPLLVIGASATAAVALLFTIADPGSSTPERKVAAKIESRPASKSAMRDAAVQDREHRSPSAQLPRNPALHPDLLPYAAAAVLGAAGSIILALFAASFAGADRLVASMLNDPIRWFQVPAAAGSIVGLAVMAILKRR